MQHTNEDDCGGEQTTNDGGAETEIETENEPVEVQVPDGDADPEELRTRPQWLMWDTAEDKPRAPLNESGYKASWTDPDEWLTFEQAAEIAEGVETRGVGYVFANTNEDHPRGLYGTLDLDGCVDEDGRPKEWLPDLQPFFDRDAYMEFSPSTFDNSDRDGGIKIPLAGFEPPEWWSNVEFPDRDHEGVEAYGSKFSTFTGERLDGAGDTVADTGDWVEDWLAEAYEAITGEDPRQKAVEGGSEDSTPGVDTAKNGSRDDIDEWLTHDDIEEALYSIDPDIGHDNWRDVGFALVDFYDDKQTARSLFLDWSKQGEKWNEDAKTEAPDIIDRADPATGEGDVSVGTLIYLAKQHGWELPSRAPDTPAYLDIDHWGEDPREDDESESVATGEEGTFATVEAEPVIDEHDRVSIVQATDDGTEISTAPLGRLQCQACGTVVGSHAERGESVQEPNSCPACEKSAAFEPVGVDGTTDPDMPVSTYLDPPWHPPSAVEDDRIDELWDDIRAFIREHWDAGPDHEYMYDGLTAYAITTWFRPDLTFLPHLMLMGRFTGGKTRLLNTLARVSYRALVTVSATPSSMFRLINNHDVTFFVSEYHGLDPDTRRDLDAIVRGAQKRGETVTRTDPAPDSVGGFNPSVFDPFTHVAVATQYEPADDIISRCVKVHTSKSTRSMPATLDEGRATDIRNRLLYTRLRYLDSVEFEDAERSAYGYCAQHGIEDRAREKALALLTVADMWDRTEAVEPFIEDMVQATAEAEADSEDAQFIEALRDLSFEAIGQSAQAGSSNSDPFATVEVPLSEVKERYNAMTGEERTSSWIGQLRARHGIEKERKQDGTVISDPDLREKLEDLCDDFGLGWESLDVHDPVEDLESGEQLKTQCSECETLEWIAHRHVDGHFLCSECAASIRRAHS